MKKMLVPSFIVAALCVSLDSASARQPAAAAPKPLVAYPAPLVTEVLFAVPTGGEGDANHDGSRNAAGDEFIEIVNPHDRPIDLAGYTLSDKRASEKDKRGQPRSGGLRFTFPRCTLQPGQVAVVFNGFEAKWKGSVGDQAAAPSSGNEEFSGALVFTMKNTAERTSLANAADWVLLADRSGKAVQLVKWGTVEGTVDACPLIEEAPKAVQCSVQRVGLYGRLEPHERISDASGDHRFSPGLFGNELQSAGKETTKPAVKPSGAPEKKPAAKPAEKPAEQPETKPEPAKP